MQTRDDFLAAGELDQLLTLQKPIESVDAGGYGEPIPSWQNVIDGDMWCSVKSTGSREVYRASQTYPTTTHVVTTRWRKGVTTKHRFRWTNNGGGGAKILNITGVFDPTNRRRKLVLFCTEAL